VQLILSHRGGRKQSERAQCEADDEHHPQSMHIRLRDISPPLLGELSNFSKVVENPTDNLLRLLSISQLPEQLAAQGSLERRASNRGADGAAGRAEQVRRGRSGRLLRVLHRSDECKEAHGERSAVTRTKEEQVQHLWPARSVQSECAEQTGAEIECEHGAEAEAVVAARPVHDQAGAERTDGDANGEGYEIRPCCSGRGAAEHGVDWNKEVLSVVRLLPCSGI